MDTPRLPAFDDSALCAQTDLLLFFPAKGESVAAAKRLCKICPFLNECLEYAVNYDYDGIWGGTSKKERRQIRADRTIEVLPVVGPPTEMRDAAWDDHSAREARMAYEHGDRSTYAIEGTRYLSRLQQRAQRASAGDAA